jgi:hypothetical protein
MIAIAYALLQRRRLAQAEVEKNQRTSSLPAVRHAPHRAHRSAAASAMPALQKTNRRKAQA